MTPRTFVPPNYRCRVRRKGEPAVFWRLKQGVSAAAVQAALEAEAFDVLKVDDYDFDAWKQEASAETALAHQAKQAGHPYDFKDSIWGELKDYLFESFDDKCAYCEGPRGAVTSGAVEHYRPKTKVQEDPAHPGYYWLAYDHENYVPVCSECNSKKGSRFPVANEAVRARNPGDPLAAEGAEILNPYREPDVRAQLTFEVIWEPGTWRSKLIHARPATPRAAETIKLLGLNRDPLLEARAKAQVGVLGLLMMDILRRPNPVVAALESGRKEFSAACLAALQTVLKGLSGGIG